MRRNYHQFCALARALDLVGERWTLLLVRELLLGPRRYGELLEALPGMGTNLLAARLETLVAQGLCERDGRSYLLTDRGRALEEPVLALARWGMAALEEPDEADRMRPDWYAVAMLAAHSPTGNAAPDERYEFSVDTSVFHLEVADGRARARRGPADEPAFRLRADLPTFLAVLTGARPLSAASVEGDSRAARRWLAAFALPSPNAGAPHVRHARHDPRVLR